MEICCGLAENVRHHQSIPVGLELGNIDVPSKVEVLIYSLMWEAAGLAEHSGLRLQDLLEAHRCKSTALHICFTLPPF